MDVLKICVSQELSIREAIKVMDETAKKIILVVSDEKLIGVITDGDIRRWILNNGDLNENISYIMNKQPIYVLEKEVANAKKVMQQKKIEALPILNEGKNIKGIIFWDDLFDDNFRYRNKMNVPVVIMAGGKGTRLYPYTRILPKPLIPIGEIPIIERIINRFYNYGCDHFFLTVNYKKEMIKSYFEDLKPDYAVNYVDENKPLGTGGSLSLLRDELKETFIVSNCDILIDADYSDILSYHKKNSNMITVVTSLKNYTIPYGVIKLGADEKIQETVEKPEFNFLVNTGMYILEPEVLKYIPDDKFYHITELVDYCIENDMRVGTYPITEQCWLDMGEEKELRRMEQILGVK